MNIRGVYCKKICEEYHYPLDGNGFMIYNEDMNQMTFIVILTVRFEFIVRGGGRE